MKIRYIITLFTTFFALGASAQNSNSVASKDTVAQRSSMLFLPMTFYHGPAHRLFSIDESKDESAELVDKALLDVYLNRPDLVKNKETRLISVSKQAPKKIGEQQAHPDIVEQVAPKAIEPEIEPMQVYLLHPNFWDFSGDYYLQFLQNYVSGNWYKGGESNYSMIASLTMQANYNNKSRLKWENKLDLKLGYATSRGDSIHPLKTSEDLIRLTSKLGVQATKHWYYTVQLVGESQFAHGYKSNDYKIYSNFLSPLRVNLSLGMDYNVATKKNKLKGSIHLAPLALNWKYVNMVNLAPDYGIDAGKHSLLDYGSEITVDLTWNIFDNMKWKTRLWAYTTYSRTEMEWENTITFQFNKWISTNVFLYPRFDDGHARDEKLGYFQFKEYSAIGFAYSF